MVYIDFDQFDDELQTMQELMDEGKIALRDDSLKIPIESLHLRKAVVVEAGSSVHDCINTMVARHFGCLVVVNKKKLCGIFTERDVLAKIAGRKLDLKQTKIETVMTPDPISFGMRDSVEKALRAMNRGGYRHLTIVNENKEPLSVLSVRDIISYVIEFFPQDVLNLPPHPLRLGVRNAYGG